MAEIAEQRSSIYGFLALVYLQEPSFEFIKWFKNSNISDALKELRIKFDRKIQNMDEKKLLEELVLEYNRLFLGPGKHISLYESVWRDKEGLLWSATTSEVKRFIQSLGLEYRSDWTDIPDHIGAELEFMQKLTKGERGAWKRNNKETALRCLNFEKKFIDEHLSQWVPIFCKKVIKESHVSFYREIAKSTNIFIEFDKKQINDLLFRREQKGVLSDE
jgi:TorA maturation chaperone TorD